MILPELVGAIASFASVLISQPPQISRQDPQRESGSTPVENHEHEAKWKDVIHREYERGNESKLQDTNSINSVYYVSIGNESCIKPSFRQSLHKSLRSNIGIMLAVIPLGLSVISFAYFVLKIADLCFEREYHNNNISFSVTRWQLIGEDISSIPVCIWFPVIMALLVGWKEYKSNYLSTLYIAFAVGAILIIYKSFLVHFGVFRTKIFYRLQLSSLSLHSCYSYCLCCFALCCYHCTPNYLQIRDHCCRFCCCSCCSRCRYCICCLQRGCCRWRYCCSHLQYRHPCCCRLVIVPTVSFIFLLQSLYRYPADIIYVVGIFYSIIVVARKFRKVHPSTVYSTFHITFVISFSFAAGLSTGFVYRYFIVPYFNKLEDKMTKAIMAAIIPAVALIPTAICKYLALKQSSEIIQPDRSFPLAYFLRGTAITIYRIMQANFNSRSLFIGFSLLHGLSNVFSKATEGLREKMWTALLARLRRTRCCRRLELLSLNTPHHRRLKADIEIQNILFEYNTLILSQAYLVLYLITSFDTSPWPVIKVSLINMAIGLGIDFFFNCISVFIQIHYHDVPMQRVWLKFWKRHVIANAIILMVVLYYFSTIFYTIFETRRNESAKEYTIRNCTSPFHSW